MKQVTLTFIIHDEDEDGLDLEIRQSPLLSEWPLYIWFVEPATEGQIEWFEKEYQDEQQT